MTNSGVSRIDPGPRRAWGWVRHLLDGGTTRWSVWEGEAPREPGLLPGAQQLEVLRRLNELDRPSYGMAQRILSTSGSGRGLQELDLIGVREAGGYGAQPVRPREIPLDELHRVAAAVLSDLAVLAVDPTDPDQPRPRVRRTRYRLGGDPLLARGLRRQLRGQGWPPGGRRPVAVIVLSDYSSYLADVWTTKARLGDASTWRRWLDSHHQHPGLVGPLDVIRQCDAWASALGPDRVRLAFGAAAVAEHLGSPPLLRPHRPSHAASEAMRQVAQVLRSALPPTERRRRLDRVVGAWFDAVDTVPDFGPPPMPRHMTAWVEAEARRLGQLLSSAGYPVLGGGLDRLVPDWEDGARPDAQEQRERVLSLMLRAMHVAGGGL